MILRKRCAGQGVSRQILAPVAIKLECLPALDLLCAEQPETGLRNSVIQQIVRIGKPKAERVFVHVRRRRSAALHSLTIPHPTRWFRLNETPCPGCCSRSILAKSVIIGAMAASSHTGVPEADRAHDSSMLDAETVTRRDALDTRLAQLGSVMVAYSGGVDSAFLAATAHRVLGNRVLAVLADSPSLARRDLEQATAFARSIQMPLRVVATEELERPEYQRNDANRCFHCKDELFAVMKSLGAELGYTSIAYGMNADDRKDFRPGQRAAEQHAVLAPLAEVGLTKLEVRALARAAGYPLWDRPAAPCLASRVEYGRTVTREVLEQVERGEEAMRQLGFRELRVRHHGDLARVEIARAELPRALSLEMLDAITAALKQAGYQYVTLDAAGFRSGSMNAILPADILLRRGA